MDTQPIPSGHPTQQNRLVLILILGSMTALSPFSIDMYLSSFPQMAQSLGSDVNKISMTLSSYFIGLASGQLFYGPLMDRFGRKRPLYIGLLIFILTSIGCAYSSSLDMLITLRFFQAVGGCSAGVASFAMVRDLFEPKESAKVLSSLILILGVSPLLAPTLGGYISHYFGWSTVFMVLAAMAVALLTIVKQFLPESHEPDPTHILRPLPILKNYLSILQEPQFYANALAGAVGFSALFVYLAASPIIFMEIFGVTEQHYGWIFAIIAAGLILMSQLNVVLLKKYRNEQILLGALSALLIGSLLFFICALNGWYNLYTVIATLFALLSCIGLSNPNSASLAMAPFSDKAGSAAALIGFLQMSIGALASLAVGVLKSQQLTPVSAIFVGTSTIALVILVVGNRKILHQATPLTNPSNVITNLSKPSGNSTASDQTT
ncbi:MAG: multidrug effflux MFS transporter [Bdellovibrionaceae bacterium]|nr:multidrug effflux MFS transporter [Pseudobdellovibrionaceae bacterium]